MTDSFDDRLDQKVSQLLAGDGSAATDSGYERLALQLIRVAEEQAPRLSNSARARDLAQLRARAKQQRATNRLARTWRSIPLARWVQVAAIALVIAFAAGGVSNASAGSLPGSPLYPVKRLTEQSQVLLTRNAAERARLLMELANRRLDEVQRLVASQQRVDQEVLDTIDDNILEALTEIARTHGAERLALLKAIIEVATKQERVLNDLAANSSASDRANLEQVSRVMEQVAALANAAQSNPSKLPPTSATSTATSTASPSLTVRSTASPTGTGTPTPTATASSTRSPSSTLTRVPGQVATARAIHSTSLPPPLPTQVPAVAATEARKHQSDTPHAEKKTEVPAPSETPKPEKAETKEAVRTETPEPEKHQTSEPPKGKTREPDKNPTREPEPTRTRGPEATKTREPDRGKTPEPGKENTPQPPLRPTAKASKTPQPDKTEIPEPKVTEPGHGH